MVKTGTESIKLLSVLKEGELLTMRKIITLFLIFVLAMSNFSAVYAAFDLEAAITLNCSPSGMTAVVDTETFAAGSRMSVLIYPETANSITQIIYADAVNIENPGEELTFTHMFGDDVPEGRYSVKFSYSPDIATGAEYVYSWKRLADDNVEALITALENATADDFQTAYSNALTEELIDLSKIDGTVNPATLGEYFVMAREAYAAGLLDTDFRQMQSSSDVEKVIEAAVLIRELQTGTQTTLKNQLANSYDLMPAVFTAEPDYEEFSSVYTIKSYADEQALVNGVKLGIALSMIKNGSYADVELAITNYSDALGINLSELSQKNISIAALAKELDNTVPANYLDGLSAEMPAIINKLAPNDPPPQGGGGGGGGGGAADDKIKDVVISNDGYIGQSGGTTPNIIEKPSNTDKLPFADLDGFGWAVDSIADLYADGIINGVSETEYEPGRSLTREEFVTMLVLAFDIPMTSESDMVFEDCPIEFWAYPYIEAAFTSGIISGRGNGLFGAGENITRQDVAVVCGNILRNKSMAISFDAEENVFTDQDNISNYAKSFVLAMKAGNIISGYPDGSFGPFADTTRAEAAVILKRLISYVGGNN